MSLAPPSTAADRLLLRAEQTQLLYAGGRSPLLATAALAAILASVQWGVIDHHIILFWLSAVWLIAAARFMLVRAYRRAPAAVQSGRQWMTYFRLGALGSGLAWGSAGFLLFPQQDVVHQTFTALALAGVTTGAVIAYSVDWVSMVALILPTTIPFAIRAFIEGSPVATAMGLMAVVFVSFAATSVHNLYRNLRTTISLRLQAASGVESLRQKEEDLRLLNNRLTSLIEAIPDAVVFKDGEGRWLIANESAKTLFKLQGCAWQGLTDREMAVTQPELSTWYQTGLSNDEKAWQSGELSLFQERISGTEGSARYFEVRRAPGYNPQGQREWLAIIGRDVTERKLADEALRESEERFRHLLADVPTVAVQGYTMEGVTHYWNQASENLYGWKAEEAIGKNLRDLIIPIAMKPAVEEAIQQMVASGEAIPAAELTLQRKDGSPVRVFSSHAMVRAPGRPPELFCLDIDMSKLKSAEHEIHQLAYYDPLTRLPNRRLLQDRLQQALAVSARHRKHGAILFIDLDNFKMLNDTHGHNIGDLLLMEVAQRLRNCLRAEDSIARLGGDEFVVMLEYLSDVAEQAASQAEMTGRKILEALNQPYILRKHKHYSTASMGISLFLGDSVSMEELLKHADAAMYQAKQGGRNTLRFFDAAMQSALEARLLIEMDLRHALAQKQLRLHYQLQVDNTRQATGAEALLRWQHPTQGVILPEQFIAVAEECGLIVPIGLWVLREACLQLKRWEKSALTRKLQLAVNISQREFAQMDFADQVGEILRETAINPKQLRLELTESLMLVNAKDVAEKMQLLKKLGVSFSLDDFGSGCSSLAHFKRLPIDQVKIDQSFVSNLPANLDDAAIVKTIIAMTGTLGLKVIAEGVENEAQLEFLQQNGCGEFQGNLFGKPLPLGEFEQSLAASS